MGVAEELIELLGEEAVGTAEDDLAAHSHDHMPGALIGERATGAPALPVCVVRPADTDGVGELLRWASDTRTPVVPFGAGSDVCGALAPEGAVVVDMGAMNQILDLDERSRLVTVQPGCMGSALASWLEERDLFLGNQPQSIAISTVGGWVATKACGQLSAGYGGMEDLVRGLEVVLPGGRVVRRHAVPRRVAGPEIAWLLLGSEGTLGVITEVTLRVSPVPVDRTDACVSFEHMADGVAACRAIAQSDLRPTLVRLYDREDAFLFGRHLDSSPEGPLLLLSFDGFAARARCEAAVALTGGRQEDEALVEHWWEHRNDAVNEYVRTMKGEGLLGPHGVVDTMEVSGTWSVLRELYHSMKEAFSAQADLAACHISHVYPDGACLYFTLASSCENDEQARSVNDSWWNTGMRTCLDAGGSISHHHGIGRLKAPWLEEELGGWFDLLKSVKTAFDPNGIMNPGALGL